MPLLLRFLPVASLLALALSCQQKPAETTAPPPPPAPPAASVATAPTVAQRFSPIISGAWVNSQYLSAVEDTRSPEKASESFPDGPVAIFIKPVLATADSIQAGAVYNMHEGGELTVLFRAGREPNSVQVKLSEGDNTASDLVYHISPTDTTLTLISRETKQIKRLTYRRALRANGKTDLSNGVENALNKILVAGSYAGTDSLGHPVQARFSADGQITGLPFTTYLVLADFFSPSIGNELIFDSDTRRRKELAAVFGRDTLRLYTIHETIFYAAASTDSVRVDSAYSFRRGRLRYQLVRVK